MPNILALPSLRLTKWLFVVLTLGALGYMAQFFMKAYPNTALVVESAALPREEPVEPAAPDLPMVSYDQLAQAVASRNIFSSTASAQTAAAEQTPLGQLPSHLKIVGILIANPSQIVIEDAQVKQTYFITQGAPQGGIDIARVNGHQMVLSYQGQEIAVELNKKTMVDANPDVNAQINFNMNPAGMNVNGPIY